MSGAGGVILVGLGCLVGGYAVARCVLFLTGTFGGSLTGVRIPPKPRDGYRTRDRHAARRPAR